tara:strand:- start:233 stop:1531 length:1299 start_codon:yes stop_codon:yes gene_type:complete
MLNTINSSLKFKKITKFTSEAFYFITDSVKLKILQIGNLFRFRTIFKKELVIVTAADKYFYQSLLQLLQSISYYEPRIKVIFYDLGLDKNQRSNLKDKFELLEYRIFDFSKYPSFFNKRDEHKKLGAYAWKSSIINETLQSEKLNLLWLDAGNILTGNLNSVRTVLTSKGFYSPISNGTVSDWTHKGTIKYLSVQNKLLMKRNLTGGIVGFNFNNKKSRLLAEKWKNYCSIQDCIAPKKSNRENHRQDQSVLTILFYQDGSFNFPLKSKTLFNLKVNQNPGIKTYLTEGYGNQIITNFRESWYKKNSIISTNTISMADIIWVISPMSLNKIPKKYLNQSIVIVSFFDKLFFDKKMVEKYLSKYEKYIDYYLVNEEFSQQYMKFMFHKSSFDKSKILFMKSNTYEKEYSFAIKNIGIMEENDGLRDLSNQIVT